MRRAGEIISPAQKTKKTSVVANAAALSLKKRYCPLYAKLQHRNVKTKIPHNKKSGPKPAVMEEVI